MNKVILMGRLTRDPEVRYSAGDNSMAIARYTLAVDRRFRRDGDSGSSADFIGRVAFGRSAICRKISSSGYEDRNYRPYPDRQLYEPGWPESLYNGCSSGRSGVRREQISILRRRQYDASGAVTESCSSDAVTGECIVRRWIHEHPGRNRRRASVQLDLNLITVTV